MAANVPNNLADLFSPVAFKIYIQWLLFQVLLNRILPGKVKDTCLCASYLCSNDVPQPRMLETT